jgi:RND family efflux transporter MFP subunit
MELLRTLVRRIGDLLPAAASLVLASCGGDHATAPIASLDPVSVETVLVEALEVPVFEEVVGTVRPRKEAQVSAKVTGRLLEMGATPGMRAKAGEVLARLEVGELDAALARAEAALAQAERDLARLRNLRESGAISVSDYEQAEARQSMAAATVAETRTMVENASVTAPFDGTVTRRYLEPGDLGTPGRPIFAMEDSSLLRLEINVGESLAGSLALGSKFRVEVSGAGADLEGVVGELSPSADVGSRTFLAKLDLPPHEALRAGQFGRAFLPRGARAGLLVPESAVFSRGQMDYVFVAAEGVARLRIVSVGTARGGRAEILAGLDGGERVVVAPPPTLRDGQPLEGQ